MKYLLLKVEFVTDKYYCNEISLIFLTDKGYRLSN